MGVRPLLTGAFVAIITAAAPTSALAAAPIMPLSQVKAGMDCTGMTVVQGTTISSFNVHVIDVIQDPSSGGTRILISASGPAVDSTGIAEGFSGSPVFCPGPSGAMLNAGAISAGVGQFGNAVGLVTPIETMLGEPVTPPSDAAHMTLRAKPLLSPLTVSGLSPATVSVLQRAGRRVGRTVASAPASSPPAFGVQALVPGASVAASYSSGAVSIGAIGTVTYRNGSDVYAFGHEFDGAGRRSILLQDAYVYYVVGDPNIDPGETSYKLAVPGHTVGTLTSDTPAAVIGTVGAGPTVVPVDVIAHDLDTGNSLTESTQVADETDVGTPLGTSLLDLVGPLAIAQAATDIYNGPPANESGRMCLSVSIRETQGPLRFCNRYVGTGAAGDMGFGLPELALSASSDAGSALALIDAVQFAKLHVTHVTAQLDAQRGLQEASIVSAHAPTRVKAGHRVTVALRIRVYRGKLRVLRIGLRIPAHVHGRLSVKIAQAPGAGGAGVAALLSQLTQALGGNPFGSGQPTASIPALRQAFAATGTYDGLDARFTGRPAMRFYRDPKLLITGKTRLAFRVSR